MEKQHLVYIGLGLDSFSRRASERETARRAWGINGDEIVIGQASVIQPRKRIEDFLALVIKLAEEDRRVVGDSRRRRHSRRRTLLCEDPSPNRRERIGTPLPLAGKTRTILSRSIMRLIYMLALVSMKHSATVCARRWRVPAPLSPTPEGRFER